MTEPVRLSSRDGFKVDPESSGMPLRHGASGKESGILEYTPDTGRNQRRDLIGDCPDRPGNVPRSDRLRSARPDQRDLISDFAAGPFAEVHHDMIHANRAGHGVSLAPYEH